MAPLKYRDEHNRIGFLEKPKGSTDYHQDLSKLYGMVVKHYEVNPLAVLKFGMINRNTPYPLSALLMKKMLKHKLEVEIDGIGNDMTYVVQLIKFIKNQLASSVPSA
ncbi:hypothetical protein Tco_0036866 [Tanacetum coccineum]